MVFKSNDIFIIAEIGMNHNGDFDLAVKSIEAAAKAGATAVKFQTFNTRNFLSAESFDIEERAKYELNVEQLRKLSEISSLNGVEFFSTPLDLQSVADLNHIGVNLFKIASADINNVPLIDAVMETKKPIIVSTGYCEFWEIQSLYEKLVGKIEEVAILHCVAKYPADIEHMNLSNIALYKDRFTKAAIGFSDHSKDVTVVPAVAYGAGARIFEKHFTLDNSLHGYDHKMSLNPLDFEKMCNTLRACELTSGKTRLDTGTLDVENERKLSARRSIYYNQDVKNGSILTEKHLIALRPGNGVSVSEWNSIKGLTLKKTKKAGQRFEWDDVQ